MIYKILRVLYKNLSMNRLGFFGGVFYFLFFHLDLCRVPRANKNYYDYKQTKDDRRRLRRPTMAKTMTVTMTVLSSDEEGDEDDGRGREEEREARRRRGG